MHLKVMSKEVLYADETIPKIGIEEINLLKNQVEETTHKRIRVCMHKTLEDPIHEMFIVMKKGTYVRPQKHLNKTESFHLVEGRADLVLLDDDQRISEVIQIGNAPDLRFYYRLALPLYHTLILRSDFLVFHEAAQGPFRKTDTVCAPWAPDESDMEAGKKFLDELEIKAEEFLKRRT